MAFKKQCPECGEWSYSASNNNLWQCATCGAKIHEEKAYPSEQEVVDDNHNGVDAQKEEIMNREIKFRAWDKDGEHMMLSESIGITTQRASEWHISSDGVFIRPDSKRFILMQYIGLKDIDNKEIYEGDILGFKYDACWVAIGYVKYCEQKDCIFSGMYYLAGIDGKANDWAFEDEGKPSEWHFNKVIGNIYEDSDLLEEWQNE